MKQCSQCNFYEDTDGFSGECHLNPPVVMVGKWDEAVEHCRSYRPSTDSLAKACSQFKDKS